MMRKFTMKMRRLGEDVDGDGDQGDDNENHAMAIKTYKF